MSKPAFLHRTILWSVFAALPATGGAALLLAGAPGCGSGDCVIITTGTKDSYEIEFVVTSTGEFGALQAEVSTVDCNGEWEGRADQVDCEALVEAVVAANHSGQGQFKVGMISLAGIETPAAVLRCRYRSFDAPDAADFRVEVLDAADTASQALQPAPDLRIGTVTLLDDAD